MTEKQDKMVGIILTLGALAVMSKFDTICSPSVASMQAAFPDADPATVESIISVGSTGSMITGVVSGFLLSKLSYKAVGAMACLCIAVGGIAPIFIHSSISQLIVCAIIVGLGTGATSYTALAAHYFKGDAFQGVQGKLMVARTLGSTLVLWIGGFLAVNGWVYNYYLYFLAIVALVLVLIFAPNETAGERSGRGGATRNKVEGRSQNIPAIVGTLLLAVFSCMIAAVLYTKLSVYLSDYGLGDSSTAGTILMFYSAATIVVGMFINQFTHVLKSYTVPFAFFFCAIGGALFAFTSNLITVALGTFFLGLGVTLVSTKCPFLLSNLTEQKYFPLVMGFFTCAANLGFSASTMFFRAVTDAIGLEPVTGAFLVMTVLALAVGIVLVLAKFQKRMESNYLYE